ncbi:MAG: TIR domain-containing protein [Polyangiaceae bacterium]|nr:TIR domain-containing protein [Polyangiaceae bacterium]
MALVVVANADVDDPMAKRLADMLRSAGHEPWLRHEDIPTGASIPATIAEAIERCDFVVVCLSHAAVSSGWVTNAVDIGIMRQLNGDLTRVLPVRFGSVEPPAAIQHLKYEDLFPDEEGFRRGMDRLLQSISEHTGQPAAPRRGSARACLGTEAIAPHPDLRGTWEGTFVSNWVDPTTNRELGPREIFMIVRYTETGWHMRMLSAESQSTSFVATVVQGADGQWTIHGTYRNEPMIAVRARSPIHNGAIQLRLSGTPPITMSGHYWTDRDTKGEMSLRVVSEEAAEDYATARALARSGGPGRERSP